MYLCDGNVVTFGSINALKSKLDKHENNGY